jgi:hypothetical protein
MQLDAVKLNFSPDFLEISSPEPLNSDDVVEVQKHIVLSRPNSVSLVLEPMEGHQTFWASGELRGVVNMPMDHEESDLRLRFVFLPTDCKGLASSEPFEHLVK